MVFYFDIKYFSVNVFLPILAIFVFSSCVEPAFSETSPHEKYEISTGHLQETDYRIQWYEGSVKKQAWMAADEIALFPKKGSHGHIDISEIRKIYQATAEIYEQNDFVTYIKSGEPFKPEAIGKKLSSLYEAETIGFAGPVFYISPEKEPGDRVVMTGKLVVRYPADYTKRQIQAIEAAYGLAEKTIIGFQKNTCLYELNNALKAVNIANQMHGNGHILYAYPDRLRERTKRSVPNDPLFPDQWHLENTGQGGGVAGEDVDIITVWNNYRGTSNEIIAIVDDGLEINHEDLRDNIIPDLSWDYSGNDSDPTAGDHGTCCAGVAAGRGYNAVGITGAAPNCGLAGYRLLDALTDENEALASTRNNDIVDIYSNSWGPYDDAKRLEGPGPLMLDALARGVENGRGGLGSIFVWAGGNGYDSDNSNYDGYANSRYTIAVAASTNYGTRSSYSEKGANILVNAPSDGGSLDITTTDRTGSEGYEKENYTDSFGGTSSATPLVSGIIALMLQANPDLTWRDVQHILVSTAEKIDPDDGDWCFNAAGYHINHKYGFGRVDADSAVESALLWTTADPEAVVEITSSPNLAIPDNNEDGVSDTVHINDNLHIEFVEVYFTASDHTYWGDLEITLISPGGTHSILAEKHRSRSTSVYDNWCFGTIRHYGETSGGNWTLLVRDLEPLDSGTLESWTLKIYGTPINAEADLNITIMDAPDPAIAGESITYTISIFNDSPSDAVNVILKNYPEKSIKQVVYAVDGDTLWKPWPGSLNLGTISGLDGKTVLLRGSIDPSAGASIINTAKVISRTIDPDRTNNTVVETTEINPPRTTGDLNGDGTLNLEDLVTAVQVMTGINSALEMDTADDIDGDGKIGMAEAIFIMQAVGDIR